MKYSFHGWGNGDDKMSDDDLDERVSALIHASRVKSDTAHDNILDSIHEKDFITFLQLRDELSVLHDDTLGICNLWHDLRSVKEVIVCKERVNAVYDGYESDYVNILNKLCGR